MPKVMPKRVRGGALRRGGVRVGPLQHEILPRTPRSCRKTWAWSARSARALATATALFGEMGMSWWQDHAECELDRRRAHAAPRGRRRTSKVDAAACVRADSAGIDIEDVLL